MMWYVPAVVNGPSETVLLVTCTLLTVGAADSFIGTWFPLTHEPFIKLWNDGAVGTTCRLEPFATFTHASWNVVARVCTVPVAQFPLPPPLGVGVEPPPLFVIVAP